MYSRKVSIINRIWPNKNPTMEAFIGVYKLVGLYTLSVAYVDRSKTERHKNNHVTFHN